MSEKERLEHQIARQVDRLHELSEAASHDLQTIIQAPDRMTILQLTRLAALAQHLIDALEEKERIISG